MNRLTDPSALAQQASRCAHRQTARAQLYSVRANRQRQVDSIIDPQARRHRRRPQLAGESPELRTGHTVAAEVERTPLAARRQRCGSTTREIRARQHLAARDEMQLGQRASQ